MSDGCCYVRVVLCPLLLLCSCATETVQWQECKNQLLNAALSNDLPSAMIILQQNPRFLTMTYTERDHLLRPLFRTDVSDSLRDALFHGTDRGNRLMDAVYANDVAAAVEVLKQDASTLNDYRAPSYKEYLAGARHTPLDWAVRNNNHAMASLLLNRGAKPNKGTQSGIPPISAASDCEMIRLLLSHGADIERRDPDLAYTPLYGFAVIGHNTAVVQCLLKHGARVNVRDKRGTPLVVAAGAQSSVDTMKCLLEHGAQVNIRDAGGRTALHWAVQRVTSVTEITELLLKHRADVNVKDRQGKTPLQYALDCKREEIGSLLRSHAARSERSRLTIDTNDPAVILSHPGSAPVIR